MKITTREEIKIVYDLCARNKLELKETYDTLAIIFGYQELWEIAVGSYHLLATTMAETVNPITKSTTPPATDGKA